MPSEFRDIIGRLERQKAAIEKAIAALAEVGDLEPPVTKSVAGPQPTKTRATKKKRVLSPEGRQRIIEATKRRWAKVKRAAKKAA
jgi:hypothetical protein